MTRFDKTVLSQTGLETWQSLSVSTVRQTNAGTGTRDAQGTSTVVPAKEHLEFLTIDILVPLPKTSQENHYMLFTMDSHSNLTRALPMADATVSLVANQFIYHLVIPLGSFEYFFIDRGPQFVRKFFQSVSRQLRMKQLTNEPYHPYQRQAYE